ncbi:hypothetical protein CRUP_002660 [Coryphaenoides rupestris]|nr:hypothetical protein CRUP_002660 [Coryphaenoides rupestris]
MAARVGRTSGEPRTEKMDSQQDWTAVYPTAAPFKPGSVPLPVRMGYPMRGAAPAEKKGNLELVKIPNFLHLTPAAIKKHCEVLKRTLKHAWSTSACPLRQQNYDYAMYLLTVLYHEAWAEGGPAAPPREELLARPDVQEYRDSVSRLKNEGESETTTLAYKASVKKLFGLASQCGSARTRENVSRPFLRRRPRQLTASSAEQQQLSSTATHAAAAPAGWCRCCCGGGGVGPACHSVPSSSPLSPCPPGPRRRYIPAGPTSPLSVWFLPAGAMAEAGACRLVRRGRVGGGGRRSTC